MIRISLDTSVVIGLLDPRDIWHRQAVALNEALIERQAAVAVMDCVLAEAISTACRRLYEKRRSAEAEQLLARVMLNYPPDDLLWLYPDVPRLYRAVINLVRASKGELNFNDALIAVGLRERNIPFIASFDSDFDQLSWLRRITKPEDLADIS